MKGAPKRPSLFLGFHRYRRRGVRRRTLPRCRAAALEQEGQHEHCAEARHEIPDGQRGRAREGHVLAGRTPIAGMLEAREEDLADEGHANRADALLFGRVIYEMMEAAFRAPRSEAMPESLVPFAAAIDAAKKYVVSSSLTRVRYPTPYR